MTQWSRITAVDGWCGPPDLRKFHVYIRTLTIYGVSTDVPRYAATAICSVIRVLKYSNKGIIDCHMPYQRDEAFLCTVTL